MTADGNPDSTARSEDTPVVCPICGATFESVSVHDEGLLVNLSDAETFRRVCVEPIADEAGTPLVRLFQHSKAASSGGQQGDPGGRIP